MTHGIRLLADDLTGALDSAAAFAGSVPVGLGRVPVGAAADVVAVATPTRDVPPTQLPAQLAGLVDWFAGGDMAFKKVDSLLRGNTFAECAYLARAGGFDELIFAPAYPAQGRITVGGRHLVITGGQPTTVVDAIPASFAAVGLGGDDTGPRLHVPDVRTDADLQRLVAEGLVAAGTPPRRRLWCGSAGLAQALAAHRGSLPAARAEPAAKLSSTGVLMLGASHHAVVRRQWAHLRAQRPDAVRVREGDAAEFSSACQRLAAPFGQALLELSPLQSLTPTQAVELLQAQLATLVQRIAPPSTLLVIGGDTLLAICRATGVQHLQTQPARRAGWGCAQLVGGRWSGVVCHSRSGAFGDDSDLSEMLRAVTQA